MVTFPFERGVRPATSRPVFARVTISAAFALAAAGVMGPWGPIVTLTERPSCRYLTM